MHYHIHRSTKLYFTNIYSIMLRWIIVIYCNCIFLIFPHFSGLFLSMWNFYYNFALFLLVIMTNNFLESHHEFVFNTVVCYSKQSQKKRTKILQWKNKRGGKDLRNKNLKGLLAACLSFSMIVTSFNVSGPGTKSASAAETGGLFFCFAHFSVEEYARKTGHMP